MNDERMTFETLAAADAERLERELIDSRAPDPQKLVGEAYNGYMHDWLGRLAGRKFRKRFFEQHGAQYGVNQLVIPDGEQFRGQWRVRTVEDRPMQLGYFRVVPADETETSAGLSQYRHLLLFDYNVPLNPQWNLPMLSLRDFVGAPDAENPDLLLGKAYFQTLPGLKLFGTYFVLKRMISNS